MSGKLSLHAREHHLSSTAHQMEVLNNSSMDSSKSLPSISAKIKGFGFETLKARKTKILQVNIGKMCNQTCNHCHVDAGPDRKEIMTRDIMKQCIDAVLRSDIATVDITGGAPELNSNFRWFVEQLSKNRVKIIVRCNLTIILANPSFYDLPAFYSKYNVAIISSLPHFSARRTDAQRGKGVFDKSIKALKLLNKVGYGIEGSGYELHLVYNPSGAFLPLSQDSLQKDFKRKLKRDHDIVFNDLYAITNMPISRFLDYLLLSGNYESYMEKLYNAFNPSTIDGLMCRNSVSVGWDGFLYDCDFNQMLDIKAGTGSAIHISDYNEKIMASRIINVNQHCYGCTAGAGSSCGGEIA